MIQLRSYTGPYNEDSPAYFLHDTTTNRHSPGYQSIRSMLLHAHWYGVIFENDNQNSELDTVLIEHVDLSRDPTITYPEFFI